MRKLQLFNRTLQGWHGLSKAREEFLQDHPRGLSGDDQVSSIRISSIEVLVPYSLAPLSATRLPSRLSQAETKLKQGRPFQGRRVGPAAVRKATWDEGIGWTSARLELLVGRRRAPPAATSEG